MLLKVENNLELEDLKPEFAGELYNLVDKNRTRLREFLGWLDNMNSTEDETRFINEINNEIITSFAIKFENKIIGTIDFHDFEESDDEKVADIGYWIDFDFEGKGIVGKCCKTLIKYGFDELKLSRIFIHCDVRNTKSENVAKNAGFEFVKEIKDKYNLYGVLSDAKEYVLERENYSSV